MSAYTEINIKEGMPFVNDAMTRLTNALAQARKRKIGCALIIHGYGSTGKGGAIRDSARRWLKAQERLGGVKTVIFGEDFTIFNFKALELKNRYRELEQLLSVCNHGVTVVEL